MATRFVIPPIGIIGGIFGIWQTFVVTDAEGDTNPWSILIPSFLVLLSSVVIFIGSNTRRGRKKWQQYEMGDGDED